MAHYLTFNSRDDAINSVIDVETKEFRAGGLDYSEDKNGTALVTADGRKWSPAGTATFEHWGAVGDNFTDDTVAIRAATDWCMQNSVPLRPMGKTYKVSGTIIDYDAQRDGPGLHLNMVGDGPKRTEFNISEDLSDYLIKIQGDTSSYGSSRAQYWDLRDFGVISNGEVTADVFQINVASHVDIENVSVFKVRGRVIDAKEWWDSTCDLSIARSGDDGLGENSASDGFNVDPNYVKEAIRLDYYFDTDIGNSASNNIYFPKSFRLASSLDVGMYWGPGTRKNLFNGKIHGDNGKFEDHPHLILDGARYNYIVSATFAAADGTAIEITNQRQYAPVGNIVALSSMDTHGKYSVILENAVSNIIYGNVMRSREYGVLVFGGKENIMANNNVYGGGAQDNMSVSGELSMEEIAILTRDDLQFSEFDHVVSARIDDIEIRTYEYTDLDRGGLFN